MKLLTALLSLFLFQSRATARGMDTATFSRTVWLSAGTMYTEYHLNPFDIGNFSRENHDVNLFLAGKYHFSPRFGISACYAYDRMDFFNEQYTYGILNQPATGSGYRETNAGLYLYSKAHSYSLRLELHYVLQASRRQFTGIGVFHSFTISDQELFFTIHQSFYNSITDHYFARCYYHVIGLACYQQWMLFRNFYVKLGANVFTPLHRPAPFDDVLKDYAKGSSYLPSSGYGQFPLGLSLAFEYRLKLK